MKDKSTRVLVVILCCAIILLSLTLFGMHNMPGGISGMIGRATYELTLMVHPTPEPTPEPTPSPTPTPEPTPDPEQLALEDLRARQAAQPDYLILVNPWNPVPEDYTPELETIWVNWQYDIQADARVVDALMQMFNDCQDAGLQPFIISAYRDYWTQFDLFQRKIIRCIEEDGIPEDLAPSVAAMSVAIPGTSEHQLGLAFDIIDMEYTNLDQGQEETATQQWLMENCWKYGFILRYPNGTSGITGIIYEPWHYRYVGTVAAQAIYERGITFEEYLSLLYPDVVFPGPED